MSDTNFLCDVQPGVVLTNQRIPNTRDGGLHPHLIDFYIPATVIGHGLVILHGGGGTKENIARQAFILRGKPPVVPKKVAWAVLQYWHLAVAIPQGQACTGVNPALGAGNNPWNPNDVDTRSSQNPGGVYTWSNHVMWSGVDDPQFLKDLAAYMRGAVWGSSITRLDLAGHSNGGMMAWRAWFEFNNIFDHYMMVSGPPSIYFDSATPVGMPIGAYPAPVWMEFGQQDVVLDITDGPAGTGNHFQSNYWVQNPAQLSKADVAFPSVTYWTSGWRALQRCVNFNGGTLTINYSDGSPVTCALGSGLDWKYSQYELKLLSYPGHPMYLQQQALGKVGGRILGSWMIFSRST